jgi:hypothetical protein
MKPLERIFQELPAAQRLFVDIPAVHEEWVDTGLSPEALGGRRVKIGWWAKLAAPEDEPEEAVKARVANVVVRVVSDAGRKADWRHYKLDEPDREGVTFVAAGAELRMKSGGEYSFPYAPGRIEVRLAGARPTDRGTVRTVYLMSRVAPDDLVMIKSSVHRWLTYDVELEKFPDPPPLPEPL